MYYLNKIVGWVASPLGAFFLALALAWVLRRLAGARVRCRRLAAAVAAAAYPALFSIRAIAIIEPSESPSGLKCPETRIRLDFSISARAAL